MWAYMIQSALLLLAAYFVGIWLGCFLRRSLMPSRPAASKPVGPMTGSDAQAAGVAMSQRSHSEPAPVVDTSQAPNVTNTDSVAARIESIATDATARDRTGTPDAAVDRLPVAAGSDGATAVAAEIDRGPSAEATPPPAPPHPGTRDAQDLTAIRGVDAAAAAVLHREGVYRFEHVAAWNGGDVARINRSLGSIRRVQQENWIEQAAMLARGTETAYLGAKRLGQSSAPIEPRVTMTDKAAAAVRHPDEGAAAASEPVAVTVGNGAADDLTMIQGIDGALQTRLVELGVTRYSEIARWNAADVRRINGALGSARRVQSENWIEQAGILAAGGTTAFARSGGTNGYVVVAPGASDLPWTQNAGAFEASPQPAAVRAAHPTSAAGAMVDVVGDDFTRIEGINEELAAMLRSQGIKRYSHIAGLDDDGVVRLNRLLGVRRRIERENWIGQARRLIGLAVVPERATPAASPSPSSATSDASAPLEHDDLKRIRGVGALLERKLNALGFTTYAQLANWTAADIDRVSQQLDFRGRIERESWVEQARILSSGGQTVFSRRFDRSERP